MKKKIGLLIFGLTMITSLISAQESITFKQSVLPNATYKSSMQTITDSETIFGGDASSGAPSLGMDPILSNGITLMYYSVSCGELLENNKIPTVMEYDSIVIQQSNGMTDKPIEMVMLKGTKIYGEFDDAGGFALDSIVGEADQNIKNTLEQTLEQFSKGVAFPENPMKIGDDFTQEIPLSIPMPGKEPMEMTIKTNYTLTKIKKGIAYFDLIQDYVMESDLEELGGMKMTGAGTGKLEFDIENNTTLVLETIGKTELLMKVGEMAVTSKSDTQTKLVTEFSKR